MEVWVPKAPPLPPNVDAPNAVVACCGGELKLAAPPKIEPPEDGFCEPPPPPPNIEPDVGDVVFVPPKTLVLLFALPKGDDPNAFDGEDGVAPPKIEAVLVLTFVLALAPPKIFEAGFVAAAAPKIFPVETVGLVADAADVAEIPKPPNDIAALSTAFAPNIFPPAAGWGTDGSGDFTLANNPVVVLVVWGDVALEINEKFIVTNSKY